MSAFAGVRVIDGARGLAGSMACMLLADFGAEVVRLEPPGPEGAPRRPGDVAWNRNKHTLALDLAAAQDRARLNALLAGADLAVFDHGPTELARLDLGATSLTAANPRLIHLWMPPFGTTGAWSDLPAHHATLTGLAGSAFRQGSYADQPVWHVAPIVHYAQATMGAAAAGAALLERVASGLGQGVVVSGLHAMAQTACPLNIIGAPPLPRGKPTGGSPAYRLYECGDGQWLFLGTLFAHFFQRALKALDLVAHEEIDMGAAIQAKLRQAPRAHWLALFLAKDVPAGPVCLREDWLASEIIAANDLRAVIDHPTLGPVTMPGVAAKLEATPGSVRHLAIEASPDRLAAFAAPRLVPAPAAPPRRVLPLAGIKVLDLGTVIAGTYAATILANFGAEVVKIEPAEGDPFRSGGAGFMNYNRGKRGLGLDLKHPDGRALFLDLARIADVVLDNYRLGVRERLGVDYPALRAVNRRIVSCSANTYGSKGKEARLPGFDPLVQARSGMMAAQGGEGGEPVFHAIPVNDVATAALTSFAIIAALNARETTGEGQNIEMSLAAASAVYQFEALVDYQGRPANPPGGRDCLGFATLDRFYPCADGWLTLAVTSGAQFEALAGVLGHPEWLDRWHAAAALAEPQDGVLAAEIAGALAGHRRDDALEALAAAAVPAAPVMRSDEALRTEFFWDNGYYSLHSHPAAGELIASTGFAQFNGEPARFERLHPELGEHGAEVLADYAIPRARIVALAREGVIFRG